MADLHEGGKRKASVCVRVIGDRLMMGLDTNTTTSAAGSGLGSGRLSLDTSLLVCSIGMLYWAK